MPSPNYNDYPVNQEIRLLVIHCISLPRGDYQSCDVEALFTNTLDTQKHPTYHDLKGVTVSAHLFIRRSGQIVQLVPFNKRAWHAGVSIFEGTEGCNDFSIGIELEGRDDGPYTKAQYKALSRVTRKLQSVFPALKKWHNIQGHSDIAPGRKTDPGIGFRWKYYRRLLNSRDTCNASLLLI